MKVAIFGSCVSRDTCEYLDGVTVVEYVARHSTTSLVTPHGAREPYSEALNSQFQRRMVRSDLNGTGADRIISHSQALDLILIDLIDERRGFWRFEDGSSMTNSLEIEKCGYANVAANEGAQLVKFGTDEHFAAWQIGFEKLVQDLQSAKLLEKVVFLDIEWAAALENARLPRGGLAGEIGSGWRKIRRGLRNSARTMATGKSLVESWSQLVNVGPTEAEEFASRARHANRLYHRYTETAKQALPRSISRKCEQLRIGVNHKWGPQPFHYAATNYDSIADSIRQVVIERPPA